FYRFPYLDYIRFNYGAIIGTYASRLSTVGNSKGRICESPLLLDWHLGAQGILVQLKIHFHLLQLLQQFTGYLNFLFSAGQVNLYGLFHFINHKIEGMVASMYGKCI